MATENQWLRTNIAEVLRISKFGIMFPIIVLRSVEELLKFNSYK
jgi:hypothetical protein